jgi:hypothetical protein
MNGLNEFFKQAQTADDPMQALLTDFYRAYMAGDYAGAKLINGKIQTCLQTDEPLNFIKGSDWIEQIPPPPDQILKDLLDAGDKAAIIGSSKSYKSWFLLQMVCCLAAGRPFLSWEVSKPRNAVYVQFEIKDHHCHRRFRNTCRALDIKTDDLKERLHILNARGLGITGTDGIERLLKALKGFDPEVIAFDPLYKLATGVENAAEDMKKILNSFDWLAEQTGAAILYIHHDTKGQPGDKDIRDRGAGSNVLGRDYDACMTLTPHATDTDAIVLDLLLRNYKFQDPFAIQWIEDEQTGGYRFETRPDILPTKRTSANARQTPSVDIYLPTALEILKPGIMDISLFKEEMKQRTGATNERIRIFTAWATAGGSPKLETKQTRGRGKNEKLIGLPGAFRQE